MKKIVLVKYKNPKDREFDNKIGLITDNSILSGTSDISDTTPGNHHGVLFFGEDEDVEIPFKHLEITNDWSTDRSIDGIRRIVSRGHKGIALGQRLHFNAKNYNYSEEKLKEILESTGLLFSCLFESKESNKFLLQLREHRSYDDLLEIASEISVETDLVFIQSY